MIDPFTLDFSAVVPESELKKQYILHSLSKQQPKTKNKKLTEDSCAKRRGQGERVGERERKT